MGELSAHATAIAPVDFILSIPVYRRRKRKVLETKYRDPSGRNIEVSYSSITLELIRSVLRERDPNVLAVEIPTKYLSVRLLGIRFSEAILRSHASTLRFGEQLYLETVYGVTMPFTNKYPHIFQERPRTVLEDYLPDVSSSYRSEIFSRHGTKGNEVFEGVPIENKSLFTSAQIISLTRSIIDSIEVPISVKEISSKSRTSPKEPLYSGIRQSRETTQTSGEPSASEAPEMVQPQLRVNEPAVSAHGRGLTPVSHSNAPKKDLFRGTVVVPLGSFLIDHAPRTPQEVLQALSHDPLVTPYSESNSHAMGHPVPLSTPESASKTSYHSETHVPELNVSSPLHTTRSSSFQTPLMRGLASSRTSPGQFQTSGQLDIHAFLKDLGNSLASLLPGRKGTELHPQSPPPMEIAPHIRAFPLHCPAQIAALGDAFLRGKPDADLIAGRKLLQKGETLEDFISTPFRWFKKRSSAPRFNLREFMSHLPNILWASQPVEEMLFYFGPQIAFYFAWLRFYTRALCLPILFGIVVFFLQGKSEIFPSQALALARSNQGPARETGPSISRFQSSEYQYPLFRSHSDQQSTHPNAKFDTSPVKFTVLDKHLFLHAPLSSPDTQLTCRMPQLEAASAGTLSTVLKRLNLAQLEDRLSEQESSLRRASVVSGIPALLFTISLAWWVTGLLSAWNQRERSLAYRWGLQNAKEMEQVRREHVGRTVWNPATKLYEKREWLAFHIARLFLVTFPIMIVLVSLSVGIVLLSEEIRAWIMQNVLSAHAAKGVQFHEMFPGSYSPEEAGAALGQEAVTHSGSWLLPRLWQNSPWTALHGGNLDNVSVDWGVLKFLAIRFLSSLPLFPKSFLPQFGKDLTQEQRAQLSARSFVIGLGYAMRMALSRLFTVTPVPRSDVLLPHAVHNKLEPSILAVSLRHFANTNWIAKMLVQNLHTIVYIVISAVFQVASKAISSVLTAFENHRTESSHRSSYLVKIIVLTLFNSTASLLYAAFVLRDLDSLRQRLIWILGVRQVVQNMTELAMPALMSRLSIVMSYFIPKVRHTLEEKLVTAEKRMGWTHFGKSIVEKSKDILDLATPPPNADVLSLAARRQQGGLGISPRRSIEHPPGLNEPALVSMEAIDSILVDTTNAPGLFYPRYLAYPVQRWFIRDTLPKIRGAKGSTPRPTFESSGATITSQLRDKAIMRRPPTPQRLRGTKDALGGTRAGASPWLLHAMRQDPGISEKIPTLSGREKEEMRVPSVGKQNDAVPSDGEEWTDTAPDISDWTELLLPAELQLRDTDRFLRPLYESEEMGEGALGLDHERFVDQTSAQAGGESTEEISERRGPGTSGSDDMKGAQTAWEVKPGVQSRVKLQSDPNISYLGQSTTVGQSSLEGIINTEGKITSDKISMRLSEISSHPKQTGGEIEPSTFMESQIKTESHYKPSRITYKAIQQPPGSTESTSAFLLSTVAKAGGDQLPPAERECQLAHYDECQEDLLESMTQLALVVCFGVVAPLAPILAYLSNLISSRSDAIKILTMQRSVPTRGKGLDKAWLAALRGITWFSVVLNIAIWYVAAAQVAGQFSLPTVTSETGAPKTYPINQFPTPASTLYGWMDKWTDGWREGWVAGWMDHEAAGAKSRFHEWREFWERLHLPSLPALHKEKTIPPSVPSFSRWEHASVFSPALSSAVSSAVSAFPRLPADPDLTATRNDTPLQQVMHEGVLPSLGPFDCDIDGVSSLKLSVYFDGTPVIHSNRVHTNYAMLHGILGNLRGFTGNTLVDLLLFRIFLEHFITITKAVIAYLFPREILKLRQQQIVDEQTRANLLLSLDSAQNRALTSHFSVSGEAFPSSANKMYSLNSGLSHRYDNAFRIGAYSSGKSSFEQGYVRKRSSASKQGHDRKVPPGRMRELSFSAYLAHNQHL